MTFDWSDLLAALAIVCILEGLMPFLNPSAVKRLWAKLAITEERELRLVGLVSVLLGLAVLYWVRA